MLIKEIKEGSKKKINKIVRLYSSSLVNLGVSKQHIYEQTQKFFFYGEDIASLDEVEKFFYLISPTEHHYEIYFIVSELINEVKESIEEFDLSIIDSPPKDVMKLAEKEGMEPREGEVWLEVEGIQAFDRHAARHRAETRLDMLRDIFLLFSHKNKIDWRSETIITQCCDEVPVLIRRPKNSMEKCFDLKPADASMRLNDMISNIGLSGSSFVKFHRAVDLHAAGATNDLPENQLINIWIALETLIPSHVHGGGKIVKISNGIMPILIRNYLSRIIQRLSGDLIRWNRRAVSKILREVPGFKGKSLYLKVLELVAIKDNAPILAALYAELGDFHLLRHRIFEISEIFSDPKKLRRLLDEHEKKVLWQLRRIYRSRNLIVHSGRSIPYINTLVENAHDYLDQVINSVLDYSCGFLDANSIDQAFDMARVDYEVYMDKLKATEEFDSQNVRLVLVKD